MKHGARVEGVAVVAPAFERGIEIGEAHLGEKAEKAEVDAEDGRAGCGKDARNGEQGAVAAEHDDQVRLVRGHLGAIDCACSVGVGGAFTVEQRLVVVLAEPVDQFGKQLGELLLSRLADDCDACHAVSV